MYKINFFYKYPGVKYSNLEDFTYAEGWPGFVDPNTIIQTLSETEDFTYADGWPGFVDPNTIIQTLSETEDFADFYGDYGLPGVKITAGEYDITKVRLSPVWSEPTGVTPLPLPFSFNPGDFGYMYKTCLLRVDMTILDTNYEPDNPPFLSMTTVDANTGARIITEDFTVVPRIKLKPPTAP